jgi:hypothetical protein
MEIKQGEKILTKHPNEHNCFIIMEIKQGEKILTKHPNKQIKVNSESIP